MVQTRNQALVEAQAPSTEDVPPVTSAQDVPPSSDAPITTQASNTGASEPSCVSLATSVSSRSTVKARKLAIEAEHARRLAELECAVLAAQRKAADAELKAQLAAVESSQSKISKDVGSWVEQSRKYNFCSQETGVPPLIPGQLPNRGHEEHPVIHPVPEPYMMTAQNTMPARPLPDCPSSMQAPARTFSAQPHNIKYTSEQRPNTEQFIPPRVEPPFRFDTYQSSIVPLPTFDGRSHLDWLHLSRVFTDTQHSFSPSTNLARLNTALKGEAREAVAALLMSTYEPTLVMRELELRFGRPDLIVSREVATVRALPRVIGDGKDLTIFTSRVRNCVEIIRLLNQKEHLHSPDLFNALLSKLSQLIKTRWLDYAAQFECSGVSRLELLADFLSREVQLRTKFGGTNEFSYTRDRIHSVSEQNVASSSEIKKSIISPICLLCQKSHTLPQCDKFMSMTVDERWQFIKEVKVCHKCLKKGGHRYSSCKARMSKLLFKFNKPNTNTDDKPALIGQELVAHASTSSSPVYRSRPLLKIISVTVSGPSGSVDTHALLDDGSTATFIDAKVASQLGLQGVEGRVKLDCVGGLSRNTGAQYVNFKIKGKYSSTTYSIHNARSISNLGMACQTVLPNDICHYSHLADLVDVVCYEDAQPTIILGTDNWHLTISKSRPRTGTKSQPVAINTALGWVLFGFGTNRSKPVDFINHVSLSDTLAVDSVAPSLESLIEEQYKLDAIGISKRMARSSDDERAIGILERTAKRLSNGRFEVGLLWKSDDLIVPNSYGLALSRFLSLEKKMIRDPEYATRYKQNIHDTLQKGYAEECPKNSESSPCWYLPHFGVINPKKPNKLRIVHDAAAKSNGVSLNSLLLTGPDLLQPLLHIIFRFREDRIAMTADIKEMFPQLKIRSQDRDAQRFLWRDSPNEPIKTYRMSSMIFGAASSPFTALYIKDKNAKDFEKHYPDAAHAILFDHYMDDYISSVPTVDQAARLAADIVYVHSQAGFEIRGWISNNPAALSLVPSNLLLNAPVASPAVNSSAVSPVNNTHSVNLGSLASSIRTLGLIWQPSTDVITFNAGVEHSMPDRLTKRNVLSQVMRVYDPLGILAPITMRGRILFQNVWRLRLDWDEELPQVESECWKSWFEDLVLVSRINISRCYITHEEISFRELHVFCDASAQAYVAVAYWRILYTNGNVKLALIASKSRVAPLSPTSIPRLELQAALLAARLAATICEAHRHKPSSRTFWSDSKTVLDWLSNDPRNYKPFVSHRVGEILELTKVCEWQWVSGDLNVADDATRDNRIPITVDCRWIRGPPFLLHSLEPRPLSCCCTLHVDNHAVSSVNFIPLAADSRRFSSWIRLLRATATAHNFLILLRKRCLFKRGVIIHEMNLISDCLFSYAPHVPSDVSVRRRCSLPSRTLLTAGDLRRAETHVLCQSQLESFESEYRRLKDNMPLPPRSRLMNLSPKVGSNHLLYLSGRVAAAPDIDSKMKRPAILDGKHPTVRLLVQYKHQKAAHANSEMVVNEIRQEYWIISLRSTVKSIVHNCMLCRIRRAIPFHPPMGNLPEARLAHHTRPFTFSGLDYFGPIQVAIGRRREKKYVALYTCLVTRALHLEIVDSLSTDAAVMSLRRFAARRGTPSQIYSDNGTAFVGASRQLRELYGNAIQDYATNEKIEWHFIPPAAPFMGGAWERLVKSVKTALRVTMKDKTPTLEVLATFLSEAEAVINAHPLTHIAVDQESEEALTPFHFLIGSSSGRVIPARLEDADLTGRSGWRKAARLADHFWTRWVKEYLPTLHQRRGGGTPPEIKVGDLVLIADSGLPRNVWPRGRIVTVYPGLDGIVRVADVKTSAGVLKRPCKKLVKLFV